MRSVLVTGGCGFIGSNLIEALRRRDEDLLIRVLDNETMGSRRELDGLAVEFVHGDIRNVDTIKAAVEGVDTIVHLAADTRVIDSITDPQLNFDVNALGSFNLLMAARAAGVGQVLAASTGGAIMGRTAPPYDETRVPRPISPYGASKLAMEGYLSAFAGAYGMRCTALRFSNVFGPRSYHKGSVIATFMKQILAGETLTVYGDGSQVRDYVYVGDIVTAICMSIDLMPDIDILQLGAGRPTPLNELIAAIRATVGEHYPIQVRYQDFRAGEVRDTTCRIAQAAATLGWQPQIGLDEGLARTWRWFLETYAQR